MPISNPQGVQPFRCISCGGPHLINIECDDCSDVVPAEDWRDSYQKAKAENQALRNAITDIRNVLDDALRRHDLEEL